jgi:tRNA(Arg) A34 adenosine deaminase TadA
MEVTEAMVFANELAKQNLMTNNGGPFGAVVIKDGKIIGVGNNRVIGNNDPTAHAEVMAIRDACKNLNTYDLSGCIMVTSCYPCPMCLSAIIWSNIKQVYYGNTKEDAADIGFRDDFIYKFLDKLNNSEKDDEVLVLYPCNRIVTMESFLEFKNKEDKTIY